MRKLFILVLLFPLSAISAPYSRSEWSHWSDFDDDCQNTRHELLITSSLIEVTFTNDSNCTVATGLWIGAFTGLVFTKASDVDIDHVIPLKYAHDHGGGDWSPLLKRLFANDVENLLVVDDRENQMKVAKGLSEYMPRIEYQCEYIRRWDTLTKKYQLSLNSHDLTIINEEIPLCGQN
jgi:hypothetical protein